MKTVRWIRFTLTVAMVYAMAYVLTYFAAYLGE